MIVIDPQQWIHFNPSKWLSNLCGLGASPFIVHTTLPLMGPPRGPGQLLCGAAAVGAPVPAAGRDFDWQQQARAVKCRLRRRRHPVEWRRVATRRGALIPFPTHFSAATAAQDYTILAHCTSLSDTQPFASTAPDDRKQHDPQWWVPLCFDKTGEIQNLAALKQWHLE